MSNNEYEEHQDRTLFHVRDAAITLTSLFFALALIYFIITDSPWYFYSIWGLFVFFALAAFILTHMVPTTSRYADMPYEGIIVKNFCIQTEDNLKLRCFEYRREDVDETTPLPTLVSFHGWGSTHRTHDPYALPIIRTRGWRYYTFDQRGAAKQEGDKSDHIIQRDAKIFLDHVCELPNVDARNIFCIGTSMGGALTLGVAYLNPKVRAMAALAAPVDFMLTLREMPLKARLLFKVGGFRLEMTEDQSQKLSAIHHFKPEGIRLENGVIVSNKERVLLFHCRDDDLVVHENLLAAANALDLPPENVISFPKGNHWLKACETEIVLRVADFFDQALQE